MSFFLVGSDAIIRQHKAACLRITALLACKDLLWIGTSAGVVLTLSIPPVSSSTGPGSVRSPLVPMGSAHGHTGHVRFLTCIELPEGFDLNFPLQSDAGLVLSSCTLCFTAVWLTHGHVTCDMLFYFSELHTEQLWERRWRITERRLGPAARVNAHARQIQPVGDQRRRWLWRF